MGRRKERKLAAKGAAGRRVKLDLFAEPPGDLGGSSVQDEVGGEEESKIHAELPNSPSSSGVLITTRVFPLLGQEPENPLMLLGQYSDDEVDEESVEVLKRAASEDSSLDHEDKGKHSGDDETNVNGEIGSTVMEVEEKAIDNGSDLLSPSDRPAEDSARENNASVSVDLHAQLSVLDQITAPTTSDAQALGDASAGWKMVLHEESNQYYYWNTVTGETSWEVPQILGHAVEQRLEEKVTAETECMGRTTLENLDSSITRFFFWSNISPPSHGNFLELGLESTTMAFWCRVKNSKIKTLSIHLKRCYFQCPHGSNSLIASASHPSVRVFGNSSLTIPKSPFEFSQSVRRFAAPVQAKTRKEEKDTSGPRLNREITADIVRLVLDEGHRVVSIREALELARSLNLDLVEVARNSKPPVCRIMDYHKEKYQQQVKESAKKSKSELTLKKGDCKEVRFVGKIEKKDLQNKADTVKRMMERGYRVKCTAMSMGNEGEDLGAVLSRFSPLIEDVAYIESGPRVEKKQAYIVVRHVKFGPSKKGSGKKPSKEDRSAISAEDSNESASVAPEIFSQSKQNCDTSESGIESDNDSCMEAMTNEDVDNARSGWRMSSANGNCDKVFDLAESAKEGTKTLGSANVSSNLQSSFRRESGNTLQGPSGEENRYKRDPSLRSTKMADTVSDLGRQLPLDRNTLSHSRDLGSQFPRKFPEQHPSQSSVRSCPSSGFGIFSSPQADRTPGKENNVATQNRYKKSELFNSGRNSSGSDPRGLPMANAQARRPDLSRRDGQEKYPIFGDSANLKPSHNSETQR